MIIFKKKKNMAKFTCALCGGVFKKEWSEEEALAEKNELFPNVNVKDCEIVCDNCWKKVIGDSYDNIQR